MASSFEVLALAKQSFADNFPTAYLTQSSAQGITTGSGFTQVVAFNSSSEDNWSGHSNVTNNSRYTCQVPGLYSIISQITYTNTTGLLVRAIQVQKNGTGIVGSQGYNQSYSNNFLTVNTTALARLNVGDYVETGTWQNSGGTLNTVTNGTYMLVQYLHA